MKRLKIIVILFSMGLVIAQNTGSKFTGYSYKSNFFGKNYSRLPFYNYESLVTDKQDYNNLKNILNNKFLSLVDSLPVFDNDLNIKALFYSGSETGDALFYKYTRPEIHIPNKNKIIPTGELLLSKRFGKFDLAFKASIMGNFITGDRIDSLIEKLDKVRFNDYNNQYNLNIETGYYLDDDLHLFSQVSYLKFKGWDFLPGIYNITWFDKTLASIVGGIKSRNYNIAGKINFHKNDIVKPIAQTNKYNSGGLDIFVKLYNAKEFSVNVEGEGKYFNFENDGLNHQIKNEYSFSGRMTGEYTTKDSLSLKAQAGFSKYEVANKGIELLLGVKKSLTNHNFSLNLNIQPVYYNPEMIYQNYNWTSGNKIVNINIPEISENNKIVSIYGSYEFNKRGIILRLSGAYYKLDNFYAPDIKVINNSMFVQYTDKGKAECGTINLNGILNSKYVYIKGFIEYTLTNIKNYPKYSGEIEAGFETDAGLGFNISHSFNSSTSWNNEPEKLFSYYFSELANINQTNLGVVQHLNKFSLFNGDAGLKIINLFNESNKYLPIGNTIGRVLLLFLKAEFKF